MAFVVWRRPFNVGRPAVKTLRTQSMTAVVGVIGLAIDCFLSFSLRNRARPRTRVSFRSKVVKEFALQNRVSSRASCLPTRHRYAEALLLIARW